MYPGGSMLHSHVCLTHLTCICHAQEACSCVLDVEVLIREVSAVDAYWSCSISFHNVSTCNIAYISEAILTTIRVNPHIRQRKVWQSPETIWIIERSKQKWKVGDENIRNFVHSFDSKIFDEEEKLLVLQLGRYLFYPRDIKERPRKVK